MFAMVSFALERHACRMLNEDWFTTGGEDGSLALWFAMKKKPAVLVPAAHGYSAVGIPRWISAIGCLKQSDLVVSGSNDGSVRLWRADVEARSLEQVSSDWHARGGFNARLHRCFATLNSGKGKPLLLLKRSCLRREPCTLLPSLIRLHVCKWGGNCQENRGVSVSCPTAFVRGHQGAKVSCLVSGVRCLGYRPVQVASVPLEGFVNGLAVSSTGKFLVAAVGQEHRLGRWEHQKKARNEICVVPLPSGVEDEGAVAMDTESAEEDQVDIDGEETG